MLNPENRDIVDFPADSPPLLTVIVDAEEEFDWSQPVSPRSTGVSAIRHQVKAHRIFERYAVKPTYLVDYPVAAQADGYLPLAELLKDGVCEIGAHLHPWVNPPLEEAVSERMSYPGNLPAPLERAKLAALTAVIEENFGVTPRVYRAGRFGVGQATAGILQQLGYEVDTSVVPETDFRRWHGPDFRRCRARPYWFGEGRRLLEVPLSVGFYGALAGIGRTIYSAATLPPGRVLRLPAILARARLLERIRLTPEGINADEQQRLTAAMLRTGHRVFALTYHSPSLALGHTPYVRNDRDLRVFLDRIECFLDYFFGQVGGRPTTLSEIRLIAEARSGRRSDRGNADP